MEKKKRAGNSIVPEVVVKYKIGVIAAILLALVFVVFFTNGSTSQNDTWNLMEHSWVEGEVAEDIVEYRLLAGLPVLYAQDLNSEPKNEVRKDAHSFTNQTFDNIVFGELPEIPLDFWQKRTMFWEHYIKDPSQIEYEYYIQPEWFSNGESCLEQMHMAKREGWVPGFASVFISDVQINGKQGGTLQTLFWVRSACFSELYQGVYVVPEFPESATYGGGTWNNPGNVEQYFEVSFAPELFILPPSYKLVPLVVNEDPLEAYWIQTFDKNYTIPVTITIKISDNTPPGNYVIGADVVPPPEEFSDQMYLEYLNMYVPTGSSLPVSINRPYFQAFITVSE